MGDEAGRGGSKQGGEAEWSRSLWWRVPGCKGGLEAWSEQDGWVGGGRGAAGAHLPGSWAACRVQLAWQAGSPRLVTEVGRGLVEAWKQSAVRLHCGGWLGWCRAACAAQPRGARRTGLGCGSRAAAPIHLAAHGRPRAAHSHHDDRGPEGGGRGGRHVANQRVVALGDVALQLHNLGQLRQAGGQGRQKGVHGEAVVLLACWRSPGAPRKAGSDGSGRRNSREGAAQAAEAWRGRRRDAPGG